MSIMWLATYMAGYTVLLPVAGGFSGLFPRPPPHPTRLTVTLVVGAVTALGLVATTKLVIDYGSISNFVYAVKVKKELAGAYVIGQINVIGAIVAVYGALLVLKETQQKRAIRDSQVFDRKRSGIRIRYTPIMLYFTLLMINLMCIYFWGSRTNIGYVLVAAAFAFHVLIRKIRLVEIVLAVVAIGVAMMALAVLRTNLTAEAAAVKAWTDNVPTWTLLSITLHLVEFDALMLALRDAGSLFEFRLGEDFWSGLVSWIPRQIWPEKPSTHYIGGWFRRIYEPERVNGWPVTVIGSWYVNFGIVGVFFGGLISGLLSAAVDLRYAALAHKDAFAAIMPAVLGMFLLAGGYNTGLPQYYVLVVVPLFAIALILRLRLRRSQAVPRQNVHQV
jgi:hypothetical protein